jgi:hypothetical protein
LPCQQAEDFARRELSPEQFARLEQDAQAARINIGEFLHQGLLDELATLEKRLSDAASKRREAEWKWERNAMLQLPLGGVPVCEQPDRLLLGYLAEGIWHAAPFIVREVLSRIEDDAQAAKLAEWLLVARDVGEWPKDDVPATYCLPGIAGRVSTISVRDVMFVLTQPLYDHRKLILRHVMPALAEARLDRMMLAEAMMIAELALTRDGYGTELANVEPHERTTLQREAIKARAEFFRAEIQRMTQPHETAGQAEEAGGK